MINNMSNYTIKAKNKETGTIVEINILNKGNFSEYYLVDERFTRLLKEFNDLFEVYEEIQPLDLQLAIDPQLACIQLIKKVNEIIKKLK